MKPNERSIDGDFCAAFSSYTFLRFCRCSCVCGFISSSSSSSSSSPSSSSSSPPSPPPHHHVNILCESHPTCARSFHTTIISTSPLRANRIITTCVCVCVICLFRCVCYLFVFYFSYRSHPRHCGVICPREGCAAARLPQPTGSASGAHRHRHAWPAGGLPQK